MTPEQMVEFIAEMAMMDTCGQSDCDLPAEYDVHWPGQSSKMCLNHARKCTELGEHMGFKVESDELPEAIKMRDKIKAHTEQAARNMMELRKRVSVQSWVEVLRRRLAESKRWASLIAPLGVMVWAKAPRLRVEDFSHQQADQVIMWMQGDVPEDSVPQVLAEYVATVKAGTV